MKTTIIINDDIWNLVLCAETEGEKALLETFTRVPNEKWRFGGVARCTFHPTTYLKNGEETMGLSLTVKTTDFAIIESSTIQEAVIKAFTSIV